MKAAGDTLDVHRQVFERNRAVQLLIDPDGGRIVEANPAACQFYGYSHDELVALRMTDINVLAPDAVREALQQAASERCNTFRFQHRLKSGELRHVEVHSGPVELDGRTLLYSIVHDVTERLWAEAALHDQIAALRTSMDGVAILDDEGRFRFLNDAHAAIYGYDDPAELIGRSWRVLYAGDELKRIEHEVLPQMRRQGRWRGDALGTRRDGGTFDQEVSLTALESGGLVCVVRDVTERKRAQQALQESEERYRRLVDLSPFGILVHAGGRVAFANRAAARLLGAASPERLAGLAVMDFVHPDSRPAVIERLEGLARGREAPPLEERLVRLDGRVIDAEVAGIPFTYEGRAAVQVVLRDISQRKRTETLRQALFRVAAVANSVDNMQALYAGLHAIVGELMYARNFYIALYDEAGGTLSFPYFVDDVDPAPPAQQGLGRGLTEYVLRTGAPLLADPETFERLLQSGEVEEVGGPSVDWLGVPLKRGEATFGALVVQSYTPQVRFSPGDLELLTFVSQHVATAIERRRAQDGLRHSEQRFRTLADTAPCAIFIYQGERFVYANDACAAITGRTREDFMQLSFHEVVAPEFREQVKERGRLRQLGDGTLPPRYEFRLVRPDGEERWLDYSAGLIEFQDRPAVLGVAFDVSERKRAEEQVRSLAYHDGLTALPNRLLFNDRLELAVAQAHRLGQKLAVLFLDVDRFKTINDSLGHSQGDRVLKSVAERLRQCVREGDTVARLGGDEFTLILPGMLRAIDAAKVADKVLETLRAPFELLGREFFVTASLGISLYPDDGLDAETLLKNADTAMYRAKEQGRDRYQLYAPAMNATALERLALEASLRRALAQEELTVHYQPQLDLPTGRIHGVEALLRWPHAGSYVPPADFIPLAELTGLIVPIGPFVLRRACAEVRRWQQDGHAELCVAVNLSARQFQQADLVEQITQVLRETGLAPRHLELEITETNAMQNAESTVETLRELKALGVRISIDDFGIGYSSLSYLKRLPIDTLKIDQSFVRDITTDPDDAAIATAVIEMAHALKLRVVAEGVETEEQLAFLAARRCDRMQGYLFSRPLPPVELQELLAAHASHARRR